MSWARRVPWWTWAWPLLGWAILIASALLGNNSIILAAAAGTLIGCVFAAVYHAEVVAHRLGEPFGTLVLAVAVTVIEVALIVSIMIASTSGKPGLARDTVFAAVMITCNGIVGLCLLVGGVRHHEQGFQIQGASAALAMLAALRVVKPDGWPKYMIEKRLGTGRLAYYWNPPGRDIEKGFTLHREALGPDYGAAVDRANVLNKHLDDWRNGRQGIPVEEVRRGYGTVAWLIDCYVRSTRFLKVAERSRYEYRRALKRIENMPTKTGGVVADLAVASITPAAVDKIYDKLQTGKRVRQANLSVDIARHAWDVVRRISPSVVPAENPWRGVERNLTKKTKPAATRREAYALAASLKRLGEPHLGAAALICFEWLQRPERVLAGDITWADYRPSDRSDAVQIRHHKTGVKGWLPLD